VVDDSEDDLLLCRRALKSEDYDLAAATTAAQGLAKVREKLPSLILLDYNLPDLTGIAFMEQLARGGKVPVPIVMMTGEGNESVAVEAMKAGAIDYVVKDTAGGYLRLLPSVIRRARTIFDERNHARRLSALHDAILGTVADGILGIDRSGAILFANPSAEKMLLSDRGALVGRHMSDFLHQDDPLASWDTHPLAADHDGETTLCRECDTLRRFDGHSFPVAYTASPLDFNGGGRYGWVLVVQDITERKKSEEELILTARYDTLTGLPNRVMFQDYLAKALSRAERGSRRLALLFLDLDGFKEVNDTLGHFNGDLLLKQVGQRLAKSVRAGDLVSRLGGDEFTIVVEDSDSDQIAGMARKLIQILDDPYDLGGKTAHISASIGIALYPECGNTLQALLQRADNAMYQVKKAGKKGHSFCCESRCQRDVGELLAKPQG
jgi:diguanylate cyclase (GGDEF)-like protein/PAS domain S-box-containing protein